MGAAHGALCLAMLPTRVTGSPGRKYCSSSNSNRDGASGYRGLQAARVRTASRWRCWTQQACFLQTRCYSQRGGGSPGSQRLAGANWAEQRYPVTWGPNLEGRWGQGRRGRSWELVESDSNVNQEGERQA